MEENPFAEAFEVLHIDFWTSGSLHLLPSWPQNTGWQCWHKPRGCLVFPVVTQGCGDCRGTFSVFFAAVLHGSSRFWNAFHQFPDVSDFAKASMSQVQCTWSFCLSLAMVWLASLKRSHCARQQISNRN